MSSPSASPEQTAQLTSALTSLGFVQDSPLRWRREVVGRSWVLTLAPQRRTRHYDPVRITYTQGWRLRLDVTTHVPVRAYTVVSGFAANGLVRRIYAFRRLEVVPLSTDGGAFTMVTSDAGWLRQLLATPDALRAIDALTESRSGSGQSSSVYFEPNSLHYASPLLQLDDVTAARLEGPVAALETLARAAEGVPPPTRPVQVTAFGRWLTAHPIAAAGLLVVGAVAVLGAISLVMLGAAIAVLLLRRG